MFRRAVTLVAIVVSSVTIVVAATGKEDARSAADRFGRALVASSPADLRSILPARGKVVLVLARLAQEEGSFGPSQVEAVFRDSLARVTVRGFEIVRVECDEKTFAVVHGRASLTDGRGRATKVALHLSFEPEDGSWVVREIKESSE